MGAPTVSIIIVSYNTKEITKSCLKSIYNAKWRDEFEIIVVDNNSQDGSVEMISKEFPNIKIIANRENKLFAIANNQGAKIANGKYLLLLNSDTIIYDDNIQKLIDFFENQSENIICVGPKILNSDKSIQSYGQPRYGFMEFFICQMRLHKKFSFLRNFWKTLPTSPNITHEVGWVCGACMMIPRHLYQKVGGLNEKLEFYGEEPEFGYRTSKLGYKTLYYHESEIIHLGGGSTKQSDNKDLNLIFRRYSKLVKECNGYKEAIKMSRIVIATNRIKMIIRPKYKECYHKQIKRQKDIIRLFKERLLMDNTKK